MSASELAFTGAFLLCVEDSLLVLHATKPHVKADKLHCLDNP
ncbi:hypothetical protein SHLO109777_18970 [Shewanella loihica]